MSCYGYYNCDKREPSVVDKILEQGQKLRNAMVQSILSYEPEYNDPLVEKSMKVDNLTPRSGDKLKSYLQGDFMSKEDEIWALDTLRSMSVADLCSATDRTYKHKGNHPCGCYTCVNYREKDLNCDLKRSKPLNEITHKIQQSHKNTYNNLAQFVDSLKVGVNCVVLSEAGTKKVFGEVYKTDKSATVTQTYFLEYDLPAELRPQQQQNKSKVDSGLSSGSVVRMCSRGSLQKATIDFKQVFVHDINLEGVDLSAIDLKFNLSFRTPKQKRPTILGCARISLEALQVSKNLTCNQDVEIHLNDTVPIIVGAVRLSIQLGCGRLYFGQEFIAAINNKGIPLPMDNHSDFISTVRKVAPILHKPTRSKNSAIESNLPTPSPVSANRDVPILFGFIYVAQAQFNRTVEHTYVSCTNLFCEDEVTRSKMVAFDTNPVDYNFLQKVPLLYEEPLLYKLRDNFAVLEFWAKGGSHKDFLIGTTKLPLHQFYLTFRNSIVVKYLSEKQLPVIAFDDWETVSKPSDNGHEEITGQVQLILALGTKEQIDALECERGFKSGEVRAKPKTKLTTDKNPKITKKETGTQYLTPPTTRKNCDIGIQFEPPEKLIESSRKKDMATQSETDLLATSKRDEQQQSKIDNIESLLLKLQQPQLTVPPLDLPSSSTTQSQSTASPPMAQVKSTNDLLDSLQKAFDTSTSSATNGQDVKSYFKAHVAVNNALHLPCRKKCKARKSGGGGKSGRKSDDVAPSCYVTFEDHKGDLKLTQVVMKSSNPVWNFRGDVNLPVECLTNSSRVLVFKVWRKSTNTTASPNLQTDLVLGFATVDLTVLLAGLPSVQGWFNITDLSKKCQGQINIHVTPLEDIKKHKLNPPEPDLFNESGIKLPIDVELGRTLKRKFTELDEITQRLRLRLSEVTTASEDSDEVAEEFERDINTLCIEEDFDTGLDFEKEALDFSIKHQNKEIGLLSLEVEDESQSKNVLENKQKLDALLGKLSLLSAAESTSGFNTNVESANTSRYVSGCSDNSRFDNVFNDLDHGSRPNIHTSGSFNEEMVQKFGDECYASGSGRTDKDGAD